MSVRQSLQQAKQLSHSGVSKCCNRNNIRNLQHIDNSRTMLTSTYKLPFKNKFSKQVKVIQLDAARSNAKVTCETWQPALIFPTLQMNTAPLSTLRPMRCFVGLHRFVYFLHHASWLSKMPHFWGLHTQARGYHPQLRTRPRFLCSADKRTNPPTHRHTNRCHQKHPMFFFMLRHWVIKLLPKVVA